MINRYRYKCTTESDHVYDWRDEGEGVPTSCKNNPAHSVDWNSLVIVGQQDATPLQVVVQEEDPGSTTGGHYGTETVNFQAVANDTTIYPVTLPIPISLLAASIDAKEKHDGDEVGFDVNTETIVGQLPASVSVGATVLDMPQSVMDLFAAGILYIGQVLILHDGASIKDNCGIVTAIDQFTNRITVATPTANAFSVGHLIRITTSMSPPILNTGWVRIASGDNKVYDFGTSKIGGSFMPAGTVIDIRYKNTGPAVPVRVILEYLY